MVILYHFTKVRGIVSLKPACYAFSLGIYRNMSTLAMPTITVGVSLHPWPSIVACDRIWPIVQNPTLLRHLHSNYLYIFNFLICYLSIGLTQAFFGEV